MIKWRRGVVTAIRREWAGAVELTVLVRGDTAPPGDTPDPDGPEPLAAVLVRGDTAPPGTLPSGDTPGPDGPDPDGPEPSAVLARGGDHQEPPAETVRALAYPQLTGRPEPGDEVLLNTGALELGLGTGGYALVIAIPDRLPPDQPGPGHLVKARYTPMQAIVTGADEQGSAHHDAMRDADDIEGIPVVIADLHSALPAVLAGFYAQQPAPAGHGAGTGGRPPGTPRSAGTGRPPGTPRSADLAPLPRVAYLMLDGGALPAWFSRTAAALREADWLAGTVTVGQAFGGDVEAVTVHSGLLAARHVLGAELVVVTQGPGNLGTGTRWGFSGVAAGEAVNAVAVLGGRPVASLRISDADPRERHRGISHHSLTAYGRVALARADIVIPDLPGEFGARVRAAAEPLRDRHDLVLVSVAGLHEALTDCPVPLSTMGRSLDQDLAYFLAAAAAGRQAATLTPDARP